MNAVNHSEHRNDCHGPIKSHDFRDALARASTAVTVVATDGLFGKAGLTCSAVCSVCDNPSTILLCINRKSQAAAIIRTIAFSP